MSRSKVPQPQAIYMMTCGCFVFFVSVVPLGSLHVPMGRSTLAAPVFLLVPEGANEISVSKKSFNTLKVPDR